MAKELFQQLRQELDNPVPNAERLAMLRRKIYLNCYGEDKGDEYDALVAKIDAEVAKYGYVRIED